MTTLPCATRLDIYDALFDDEDLDKQVQAHPVAVRLCASCPAKCDQQVTAASAPRTVEVLPMGWMPAEQDGRPEFTGLEPWHGRPDAVRVHGCTCRRCAAAHDPNARPGRRTHVIMPKGSYIRPADRISANALEAAGLSERGYTLAQIAERLCVTRETAAALLRLATTVRQLRTAA